MTVLNYNGVLELALDRFTEYQRLLDAADRAEKRLLSAVRQLAREGSPEMQAEYFVRTQKILDNLDEAKKIAEQLEPEYHRSRDV